MWIVHIFFSPNGETEKIARHFYEKIGGLLYDFTDSHVRDGFDIGIRYQLAVLSLPVYGGDIPAPMRQWLCTIDAERFILNFTYGGKHPGNVPSRVVRTIGKDRVVAWTLTVVRHAYAEGDVPIDFNLYASVLAKVNDGDLSSCSPPKNVLDPFSRILPNLRARWNYRLRIDEKACTRCGACVRTCPVSAIDPEKGIGSACIRCGRCVARCPKGAIVARRGWIMNLYLHRRKAAGAVVVTR
jgi:NAD-dependent dihydropyrimidine dehydrogenase PreA subunit